MPSAGSIAVQSIAGIPSHPHSDLSGVTTTNHHDYPVPTAGIKVTNSSYSVSVGAGATTQYRILTGGVHFAWMGYADATDVVLISGGDFLLVNSEYRNGCGIYNSDVVDHNVTVTAYKSTS